MTGRVFPTIREALHHTATRAKTSMKELAAELDWSPTSLSLATTLGEDNARPFPADDAHLVRLILITDDDSVLRTLADKCGYELVPKRDRTPELIADVKAEFTKLASKVQMLLDLPGAQMVAAGRAKR